MARTQTMNPGTVERKRSKQSSGLAWHAGTFLTLNSFFFVLDLAVDGRGTQWAMWITGVWALVLAFHALAYLVKVGRGE